MKKPLLLLAALSCVTICLAQEGAQPPQDEMRAPPDGTSYTVVTSKQITKPDAVDCGYNDISVANQGVFNQELREYTEFKDGKAVRTWRETTDVFVRCYEP